jgi:hypothetical protein
VQFDRTRLRAGDIESSLSFSACETCMKMINTTCHRAQWGASESCICGLIYYHKYFYGYIKEKIEGNKKKLRFRFAIFSSPIVLTNANTESKYCELEYIH